MSRFSLLRCLHRLLAPPGSFLRAFAHAYRSPAVSAPDRKAQNTALQEEVARLRNLLAHAETLPALQAAIEAVPDGVVIYSSAQPLALNPAARKLLGVTGHRAIFDLPLDLCYPSGQRVPPGAMPWIRAAHTQTSLDWTPYLIARGIHNPSPVEIATYSLSSGAVAIVRDLSAQNQAVSRETLARHAQQTLADAARHLSRTADFDGLCRIITDTALVLLPPETRPGALALLCTFGGQGSPLVVRSVSPDQQKKPRRHADTVPPEFEFDAQSPLLWAVYLDRQAVASGDINTDARFDPPRERALLHSPRELPHPVISALILPLLPGAVASGHLLLTSPLPNAFPPALQDTLTLLVSLSASVLARAQGDLLCRYKDDQLDAVQQAVSAAFSPAHSLADTLARCTAAALGAAVCALSRTDVPPQSSAETGHPALRLWGQSPPDASMTLPPARSAAPVRCACTRTAQNALRREAASWQISIPNPPLGECVWRAFGGQSGMHSALAVPVRRADEVCGVLTLYWHGSKLFSPQDIRLAETFAALASLALFQDE